MYSSSRDEGAWLRYGLSLSGLSPRHYASLAQEAERLGFESVWVPDHLVLPRELPATYLYTADGRAPISADTAVYDPWVLLGGMATVTERIRLATGVYVLPLRHPLITARGVLTVDRLSRGRVTLGAGVGWLKEEFDIVGLDAGTRGRRADEIIPLLRRLWTEEIIEHHGTHYDIPPVHFEPKPFQRPIPIEIGGTSPAALRRAGALGDGWIEIGSTDDAQLRERLAVVLEARRAAGREAEPFLVTAGIDLDDAADIADRRQEIGVHRLVLRLPPTLDRAQLGTELQRFAADRIGAQSLRPPA
ncbi:TIGR03619 family F420-dependent LLM class oxidoreductase [uncultured Jatrophihabitans sp.]|uniref:TIGR03619 family F420-dependent LLM class oxidoreductase n=1 Tax=uncultured Jatrophihabitans sp. TaxID=1610747 RepID=UPI0035CAE0AD